MNINEEKLMLLYMGELSAQESTELLKSAKVRKQLKSLEAAMHSFELQHSNPLPEDYGHQLWNRIREGIKPAGKGFKQAGIFKRISDWFHLPQYSFVTMSMVAMLVLSAYWMGRQEGAVDSNLGQQLLAQNIQMHLTQSEIFLTQASHQSDERIGAELQTMAQRLLNSNRIFKRALTSHEGQYTALLLSNLELVLLEYANGSATHSITLPANQEQTTAGQNLLFQVKSIKQQLAKDNNLI